MIKQLFKNKLRFRGRKNLYFFVLISIILTMGACNINKKALKKLNDNDYTKTLDLIQKARAKDTTNSAPLFIYARLYSTEDYKKFNVDSAYHYFNLARNKYENASGEQKEELREKLYIDKEFISRQEKIIDSLAFEKAAQKHTVSSYQYFISHYEDAKQVPEAIRRRNQLAFEAAKNIGTYEAYKSFMNNYPDAKQYDTAESRYNTLVFEEKTKSGNLQSYENFLEVFPKSPYRKIAEKNIFEISTAGNEISNYIDFINKYPNSRYTRKAINFIYHLFKIKHPADSLLIQYPDLPYSDSLKKIIASENEMFAPIYKNGNYGFINNRGETIIETNYPYIKPQYFCNGVGEDFIVTAQKTSKGGINTILLNKQGEIIISLDNSSIPAENIPMELVTTEIVKELGAGLLLVKENNKNKLLHKGGHFVLGNEPNTNYDSIALLPKRNSWQQNTYATTPRFIKFKTGGKWGMKTMTGKTLLEPEYDAIIGEENFIIIRQNGKIAVTNQEAVTRKANDKPFNLSFIYNDIQLTDDSHVIAYSGNLETVLNDQLEVIIPLGDHKVISLRSQNYQGNDFYWLTRKEISQSVNRNPAYKDVFSSHSYLYKLYVEDKERPFEEKNFLKAYFNEKWLALKEEEKFQLFNLDEGQFTDYQYDSIRLLSPNFILLSEKTRSFEYNVSILFPGKGIKSPLDSAFIPDTEEVPENPKPVNYRVLEPGNPGAGDVTTEYLLIEYESGLKSIINRQGKMVFTGEYKDISVVNPELFIVEKEGKKGLVDSLGNELLKPEYQGIGNYNQGFLATLKNSKFGLFSKEHEVKIEPTYESMLKVYNHASRSYKAPFNDLFIAQKDQKLGLINKNNQPVTEFKYNEVGYWTDSTAIVKNDSAWALLKINSPKDSEIQESGQEDVKLTYLYENIDDFSYIKDDKNELIIKFFKNGNYGLLSNTRGELFEPGFRNLLIMGNQSSSNPNYIFLAEKYIDEADLFVMIYYDQEVNLIQRNAMNPDDYQKVYCNPS